VGVHSFYRLQVGLVVAGIPLWKAPFVLPDDGGHFTFHFRREPDTLPMTFYRFLVVHSGILILFQFNSHCSPVCVLFCFSDDTFESEVFIPVVTVMEGCSDELRYLMEEYSLCICCLFFKVVCLCIIPNDLLSIDWYSLFK